MAAVSYFAGEQNPTNQQRLREASFSFYLANADALSLRRTAAAAPASQITVDSGRPSAAAPDDELDVFPAEKYFNGSLDLQQERPWKKKLPEYSFSGGRNTPSPSLTGRVKPSGHVRRRRRRFLRLFTCSSCAGEGSLDVEEAAGKSAASLPAAVVGGGEADGMSESSSELFELESISTATLQGERSPRTAEQRRRRQVSGGVCVQLSA